jgi:type IV secretory pathway VirB10-like protein
MSDDIRAPEDLDESRNEEYDARQYNQATAPTTLTGVRGVSQGTLIAGIAATVLFVGGLLWTVVSHFHHSDSGAAHAAVSRATPGPAYSVGPNGITAGGVSALDGSSQSPFPSSYETAAPYQFSPPRALRTPFAPAHTPAPVAYHPYGPGSGNGNAGAIGARAGAAPTSSPDPSSRMTLESPKNQAGGANAQDAQASAELTDAYRPMIYKTVYNADGTVAGVFPVPVYQPVGAMPPGWGGRRARPQAYEAAPQQSYPQQYPQQQDPQQYPNEPPTTPYPVRQSPHVYEETEASSQFAANGSGTGGPQTPDEQGVANHSKFVRDHNDDNTGYVPDVSQDELVPSTVIPARLITKIVTTLPGPFTAQVIAAVYDSKTNSKVVIPVGTKLFGQYENAVVAKQNRLLMAVQELIFPDGEVFTLGGEPTGDAQGAAGVSGDVDNHYGGLFTSAILLTVLGGVEAGLSGGGLTSCETTLTGVSIGQSIQCGAGQQLTNLANKVITRELDRVPTIVIRPPYEFQVTVTKMLALDQYRTR